MQLGFAYSKGKMIGLPKSVHAFNELFVFTNSEPRKNKEDWYYKADGRSECETTLHVSFGLLKINCQCNQLQYNPQEA